jgi:hypothetical protein
MEDTFDLVILGSGSTAFAAALAAQEMNKTSVMTEERPIGGTCVNRGCLPSKNLIAAAKLLHDARNPRYPGLTPCTIELDFAALIAQKDDLVHDYRKKKYESLVGRGIRVERGHVHFVDSQTVEVDGRRLHGSNVLIATGSRPVVPEIDRLDSVSFASRRCHSGHTRDHQDDRGRGLERGARCIDGRTQRGGSHSRGRDGHEIPGNDAGLHRSAPRVPRDGRGAEDRRDLEVQGPRKALLLRGVGPADRRRLDSGRLRLRQGDAAEQIGPATLEAGAGLFGSGGSCRRRTVESLRMDL